MPKKLGTFTAAGLVVAGAMMLGGCAQKNQPTLEQQMRDAATITLRENTSGQFISAASQAQQTQRVELSDFDLELRSVYHRIRDQRRGEFMNPRIAPTEAERAVELELFVRREVKQHFQSRGVTVTDEQIESIVPRQYALQPLIARRDNVLNSRNNSQAQFREPANLGRW